MSFLKRKFTYSKNLAEVDEKYPTRASFEELKKKGGAYFPLGNLDEATPWKANLISSVHKEEPPGGSREFDRYHAPALDIDCVVHAVPSRTPGHTHLYIERPLSHAMYKELLDALLKVGLIEHGFWNQFRMRGATFLRTGPYFKYKKVTREEVLEYKHELEDMIKDLDGLIED